MEDFMVGVLVPGTIYLVGFAVIAAIAMSIYNIAQNPKTAIGLVISLIAVVAIFVLGFAFAGGPMLDKATEIGLSDGVHRMIGAMLNMVYIMVFIVLGVVLWGIVRPLFS